jgi:nucleotide-binding universal stress UspA family protein
MKRILIATDFSEFADYALRSAASIAKQTKAQLILLHVVNRPLNSEDDSYENYHNSPGGKTVICNIQDKLDALVKEHKLEGAKVIYELRYDVFRTIIKYADLHQVDMIVMGAYGGNASRELFVGSNTVRVILHAEMPVLIVKEKFEEFSIKNMVFASEFYGDVYKVFPRLKKIIDLFSANIHLLKVNTPSQFQRTHDSIRLMTEFCNKFNMENCTKNIYNDLSIEDGIINFTKLINADLIAITPNGYWRLAHVFNKNITSELMKKSIKVILSIKSYQLTPTPSEGSNTEKYKHLKKKE